MPLLGLATTTDLRILQEEAEKARKETEEARKETEEARQETEEARKETEEARKKEDKAQELAIEAAEMVVSDVKQLKSALAQNITGDTEQAKKIQLLQTTFEDNKKTDEVHEQEQHKMLESQHTILESQKTRLDRLEKLFYEEHSNRLKEFTSIRDQLQSEQDHRINAIEAESKHRQQAIHRLKSVDEAIAHTVDNKFENISNDYVVLMGLIKNVDERLSGLVEWKESISKCIENTMKKISDRDTGFDTDNNSNDNKTVADAINNVLSESLSNNDAVHQGTFGPMHVALLSSVRINNDQQRDMRTLGESFQERE